MRPVVRKARGSERAGAELDAYQVDAETHPKGEMSRSRDEVYLRWLSDRLERNGGAALELEQTKLVSFQRIRSFRKHRGRHVEGPDAVLRGVLSITNPRIAGPGYRPSPVLRVRDAAAEAAGQAVLGCEPR